MRIGGYQKTSLIDYPGKVAAVVFTAGCNFRCPYCHNRDLVLVRPEGGFFDAAEVLKNLEERRKFLDGVVLTGGEPTIPGQHPARAGRPHRPAGRRPGTLPGRLAMLRGPVRHPGAA